jgi:phosphatidylserine synthase
VISNQQKNGRIAFVAMCLIHSTLLDISFVFGCVSDGIDGKQARRTQTSGPLGELFDHGLDSWTAFLIPTCMYSVFGRGLHSIPPLRMYFCLWNVFVNFYLSHWEKHNTGVLFLPWGYDASMVVSWYLYSYFIIAY